MKTIKDLFTVMLMVLFGINAAAQTQGTLQTTTIKTATLKVWGSCEMCKTRIENAVKSEGATAATWDDKTKMRKKPVLMHSVKSLPQLVTILKNTKLLMTFMQNYRIAAIMKGVNNGLY
jgi:hypothetical protein